MCLAKAGLRLVERSVCLLSLCFCPHPLYIFLFLSSVLHFIFSCLRVQSLYGIFSYNFIFHGVTFFPAPYLLLNPLPQPLILTSSVGKRAHFRVPQAHRDVWVSSCLFRGILGSSSLGQLHWAVSCRKQERLVWTREAC